MKKIAIIMGSDSDLPVVSPAVSILKDLGIEGDYEGIGHLILGYAANPAQDPAPRKENYVYRI